MRTHYVKKARQSKKHRACRTCGHEVAPGESYKWAEPRFGPILIWCHKHTPKRSQTSSSKLGPLWDLIDEVPRMVDEAPDVESLRSLCCDAGNLAEEIADEYRDSIEAMPEALQDTSPAAEIMLEQIDALEEYQNETIDWDSSEEEAPEPDRDDYETDAEYEEALEERYEALTRFREEALEVLTNFDY